MTDPLPRPSSREVDEASVRTSILIEWDGVVMSIAENVGDELLFMGDLAAGRWLKRLIREATEKGLIAHVTKRVEAALAEQGARND